ncbi:MAG: helix-turn-helix transcriptional regulator [Thiomargarita sp.]|nr:helix-turn-helix transcriptional regulator [Thiomargarita sp.]
MQLHEQIKFIRTIKGWSREQMAEKVGISVNGYGKIERGETNLQVSRLEKIAEVFGTDLNGLVNFNENMVFNGQNNQQNGYIENCKIANQNNYTDSAKDLKMELEKSCLLVEQQVKEIDYLKQQITDLREINSILKENL